MAGAPTVCGLAREDGAARCSSSGGRGGITAAAAAALALRMNEDTGCQEYRGLPAVGGVMTGATALRCQHEVCDGVSQ
jgi:hypothetical protein